MSKKVNESGGASVGGIMGFSVPLGIKKKKKKVDEMLELNENLSEAETIAYFSGLTEDETKIAESMLDENDYVKLAEMIKQGFAESAIRQLIRNRIREVVRKQADGKFALYAPNPGKRQKSKKVGEFPTKAAARRAELERYPPTDAKKLQARRKEVEKLRKDPALAVKKEPMWGGKKKGKRKESIDRIVQSISESLFREEKQGSDWDEMIGKLSKQAILSDKTLQSHEKNIAKKSEVALKDAVKEIKKAVEPNSMTVKEAGVKKDTKKGRVYTEIEVGDSEGIANVGPIYIFVENGYPKIEISDNARVALTKMDPERSKLLRAELITVQETILDSDESILSAIQKRDDYLNKIESKLDNTVSTYTSLEITLLKNLLVRKYRKIS